MIEEPAVVVDTSGHMAAVTGHGGGCGACDASEGCGSASLARFFQRRKRVLWVQNPVAARTGDRVIVGIDESALLRSAWLAYAVPVGGLLGGAILGDLFAPVGFAEPTALISGLMCLVIGLIVSRRLNDRMAAKNNHQASVIRVLPPKPIAPSVSAADLKPAGNR